MPQLEDLDTDEPLPRRLQRHDFDRLIMLSDGVFAIAITLAALEVRLPERGSALDILAAALPVLLAYAISFWVIAAFWGAQRRLLARLARVDGRAVMLNLVVLGFVALIPSATRMIVSMQMQAQDSYLLYLSLIAACGLSLSACWIHAALTPGLLAGGVDRGYALWMAVFAVVTPTAISGSILTLVRSGSLWMLGLIAVIVLGLSVWRKAVARRFPLATAR